MKRLISCYPSDLRAMTSRQIKESIIASEGRTIMSESIVTAPPLIDGITNSEIMTSFGSDLLLLNEFDVFHPKINGFHADGNLVEKIKNLTGRLVGIDLEPVDDDAKLMDDRVDISSGRKATEQSLKKAEQLGVDFVLLTGNPSTGVTNSSILKSIKIAKSNYNGLILAGKMHSSGVNEKYLDINQIEQFIDAGSDGILLPCAGTVPGILKDDLSKAVAFIKQKGAIAIGSIGTSQESADKEVIERLALLNKEVGFDIFHIGDGGFGRIAPPQNIMTLSLTIRGVRHTYFKMAQSPLR